MIPPKQRCEEILKGPNFDVPSWTCPLCGRESTRAHWVADHVLTHIRQGHTRPEEKTDLKPGVRPIELE